MSCFIDSHCHLEPADFSKEEQTDVLSRAKQAGIGYLIVIGSGKGQAEVDNAVALSREHPSIFAGIGVHPHDASNVMDEAGSLTPDGASLLSYITHLARTEPKVVAIGETGLDYHYKNSTPVQQRALMKAFLAIAQDVAKPISLHIRDAHEEARCLVDETFGPYPKGAPLRGVVHCFTSGPQDAMEWIDRGFALSFSGILTFRNAEAIRTACAQVPKTHLLLETDCPYLAPVPLRGKRNEPAYLIHTATLAANLRQVSLDALRQDSFLATTSLFTLDVSQRTL